MGDIQSKSVIRLQCKTDQLLDILQDVEHYTLWWPKSIKTKVVNTPGENIGSKIELRPYGGGKPFYCQIIDKSDSFVKIQYSGIYEGFGIWRVEQNQNDCSVSYEIDLKIVDNTTKIISYLLPIEFIHRKLMEKIMDGLRDYVNTMSKSDRV